LIKESKAIEKGFGHHWIQRTPDPGRPTDQSSLDS
jgi:hypothetical protein